MYNKVVTRNQKGIVLLPVLIVVFALGVAGYFAYENYQLKKNDRVISPEPYPLETRPAQSVRSFTGTVKQGSQLENKEYCPEGLYLVADPGTYLVEQTTMLLLKEAGDQEPEMISDKAIINKKVEVEGIYPVQELFCEAEICECEDYILVKEITVIQ